ncbi:ankyrin [Trametes gibbosa]|nr:ankyrin [Trametes gibbosa]
MGLQLGSGGFVVPREMQRLLDQPGLLSVPQGGQTLRMLYRQNSINFSPALLNNFAQACFIGALDEVQKAVEAGTAPDIQTQETPFKHGYVSWVLFGAQRLEPRTGDQLDHLGTLKYLLEHGAPPDIPDVVGYTALHHCCMAYPRADFARVLLEHGANPNAQDKFGSVALMGAFQNNSIDAIEVLLEFGARLDIVDADGCTPDSFFLKCGPKVTAVVQKWKRKRAGVAKPLDEKACATCGKANAELKFCAKCHSTWYCSRECQKRNWPTHKRSCMQSSVNSTVTFKPFYSDEYSGLVPLADVARMTLGHPMPKQPIRNTRAVQIPRIAPGETKKMIIKVQVPMDVAADASSDKHVHDLLVYDKKRSFVCRVRKQDDVDAYMRLSSAVRTKGTMGTKAYFSAEMTSPSAVVVQVSDVLAEQAF